MSLDADAIVDRRRMRRKLTFWRVVALLLVMPRMANMTFFLGLASLQLADGVALFFVSPAIINSVRTRLAPKPRTTAC